MLQSNLFDRAQDLVKKVTEEEPMSEDGALKVASAIFKRDVLSIVTDTFQRFLDVLKTKQGETETFRNFETRFEAQVCRLNASCSGSTLPSALLSFLLLANSRIDSSQRVSIISAAAPVGSGTADATATDVLSLISYDSIVSVVRVCGDPEKLPQSSSRFHDRTVV